jgi:hypothetical protein
MLSSTAAQLPAYPLSVMLFFLLACVNNLLDDAFQGHQQLLISAVCSLVFNTFLQVLLVSIRFYCLNSCIFEEPTLNSFRCEKNANIIELYTGEALLYVAFE